jgi:hypothetical protein
MNSNKEIFGEWKRASRFVRLYSDCSERFLTVSFRNRVLETVNNCSLQVGGRFQCKRVSKVDLSKLPITQTLEIHGWSVTSFVLPVESSFAEVRLNVHQLKSVARFQNVRKLSITVSNYHTTLVDLSCLVKVEELEIAGLTLTNYHRLDNLTKANFFRCEFSDKDISCFSNLSSLALTCIDTVMDISALGEVLILKFDFCRNLSGWSSLGKSRELFIRGCGYRNASHLGNIEKLSLHEFTGNLSLLQNVIVLDLSYSHNLTDVSCLANSAVRDLNLFYCSKVSDISMLRNVGKLNISSCWNITDLTGLLSLTELVSRGTFLNVQLGFQTYSQLHTLHIGLLQAHHEQQFAEALCVSPLKSLYLYEWRGSPAIFRKLSSLQCLQSLELVVFRGELTIPTIPTLGYLKISNSVISTLIIQGSNQNYPIYYVKIMHCLEFSEIRVDRPISFMKFCSQGVSAVIINGDENIKDRFFKDVYLKAHK